MLHAPRTQIRVAGNYFNLEVLSAVKTLHATNTVVTPQCRRACTLVLSYCSCLAAVRAANNVLRINSVITFHHTRTGATEYWVGTY